MSEIPQKPVIPKPIRCCGRGRRRSRRRLLPRSCPSISCPPSSGPSPTTRPRSMRSPTIPPRPTSTTPSPHWSARENCSRRFRRCSTTWSRRNSNPAILEIDKEVSPRMARHWNPIMMNAVLFGRIALIHDNRATLGLVDRADAPVGAHLHQLPPRRRRARRGRQSAARRDQRAAGGARDLVQPPPARRRAGLVHGARRGRFRRPARHFHGRGQGRGRRARDGRQGDRDACRAPRRAVPEELVPPRPAREGLQGLHRARRQRQRQRQQRNHRRDPQPARRGREDHGLSDLRRLPAGGFHGQDAGGRAQPLGAGLEAGAGPGARRPRRAAGAGRRRRAATSRWRRGTGATTPRSCASAAPISTTPP